MWRTGGLVLAALLALAAPAAAQAPGALVAPAQQPVNVGDAKFAAAAYHDSGAYQREIAVIAGKASAWIAERAPQVSRPALVLDIDETALSNWDIIKRDDFGRIIPGPCSLGHDGPCGWAAWDLLGVDPAIEPVREVFAKARALGVAVFFISGRPESQRAATDRNLVAAGYGGYEKLYLPADGASFASLADYKTPIRAQIEAEGYSIIANMGDQPSDLFGGHGEKLFQLPNPFYRIP